MISFYKIIDDIGEEASIKINELLDPAGFNLMEHVGVAREAMIEDCIKTVMCKYFELPNYLLVNGPENPDLVQTFENGGMK